MKTTWCNAPFMGMFDTFTNKQGTFSVQLKVGPCLGYDFREGDPAPAGVEDATYHGNEGVVVVREGYVTFVGETAVGHESFHHRSKTGGYLLPHPKSEAAKLEGADYYLIYNSARDGDTLALDNTTRTRFNGPSRVFVGKGRDGGGPDLFDDDAAMHAVVCILTKQTKIIGKVLVVDPVSYAVRSRHIYVDTRPEPFHEGRRRRADGTYEQD